MCTPIHLEQESRDAATFSLRRSLVSVITKIMLFVLLCVSLLALVPLGVSGFVVSQFRRRSRRDSVIVLGTFYSANWCRSHLRPLAMAKGVSEVVAVVDGTTCEIAGVRYVTLPAPMLRVFGRTITKLLVAVHEAFQNPPTLVLGYHLWPSGIIALLLARLVRARAGYSLTGGIIEIRGGGAGTENVFLKKMITGSRVLEWLTLVVVRQFDLLLVRGRNAFQYLVDHRVSGLVRIVPGSIEISEFRDGHVRDIDVVSVCRLTEIKQPDHIHYVLAELKRLTQLPVRAVILGDGPLRSQLVQLRGRLGLTSNVEILGHINDVSAYLVRSKVFLLTSRAEGLSIALAEAMAEGATPVVANVGELGDLVEDDVTGYLIPSGDFQAYARRIAYLLENERERRKLSSASRQRAIASNNLHSLANQWNQILREIDREPGKQVCRRRRNRAYSGLIAQVKRRAWRHTPRILRTSGRRVLDAVPPAIWLGRSFRKQKQFVDRAQRCSRDQSEHYQLLQVQRLCRIAYEKSPYYHALFRTIGFAPDDLRSLEDLHHIPTMNRATIENNFALLAAQRSSTTDSDYVTTGGTGGRPLRFRIGTDRSATEYAYLVSTWERVGYRLGLPLVVMRGEITGQQQAGATYKYDPFLRRHAFSSFHLNDTNMREYLDRMRVLGPCFVLAYPSTITILARYLHRNGMRPPTNICGLLAGSEMIHEEDRQLASRVFKVPYFSWYGHSEKLVLAGECEHSSDYHVWPTYGYFELLNEDGVPVTKPGQRGEIVGTGFINTVMPFIRYRTGDYATYVGDHCKLCGRQHTLIRDICGHRTQEMLVARDGSLIPWTALNMHDDTFDRVREFQFVQSRAGFATLHIVPAIDFNELDAQRIRSRLNTKIQDRLSFDIAICDSIERTKEGKSIYVRHLSDETRLAFDGTRLINDRPLEYAVA